MYTRSREEQRQCRSRSCQFGSFEGCDGFDAFVPMAEQQIELQSARREQRSSDSSEELCGAGQSNEGSPETEESSPESEWDTLRKEVQNLRREASEARALQNALQRKRNEAKRLRELLKKTSAEKQVRLHLAAAIHACLHGCDAATF